VKVVKPGRVGVLTRCFEREREFRLGVCALVFVPLARSETIMLSEIDMWKFAAPRLGAEGSFDATIPKVRAEFLVNGTAHAPDGVARPSFPVRARVGPLEKNLQIHGDRFWVGSRPSDPIATKSVPLGWAQAFGGEGFDRNPLGKGLHEVEIAGVKARPLPNVELPRQLVTRPSDRPEPAGYGQIDISWPQRSALAGTYDQKWLETLFPGFAKDVDWGIHNVAPRDQQREGVWAPGDEYTFINLHPDKPVIEGALPALRARAFISRSHRRGEPRPSFDAQKSAARRPPKRLEEIELALQTLWFFPDAERAVLIWSGSTVVAEEDGADVLQLMTVAEHVDRPKPIAHYEKCLADRLDEEHGLIAALREHELLPEDLAELPDQPPDEAEELSAIENLALENFHRRRVAETQKVREIVAGHGLDPDEHAPKVPEALPSQPVPDELPELLAKMRNDAETAKAQAEAKRDEILARGAAEVEAAALPGFTPEVLQEEIDATKVGPPTYTAKGQRAQLERIAMEWRTRGVIADEVEEMIADEALYQQWLEAERGMMRAYRMTAHHQNPAPAMPPEVCESIRAQVLRTVADREDFGSSNFTGADLRGMNLRGADLRGALFESADLREADLSGARLDQAVLAHANLTGTRLEGASLVEANLGKAHLESTVLDRADLTRAVLTGARLEQTKMQGATLDETSLIDAHLRRVDARGLSGERLQLLKMTIEEVDFGGAKLAETVFLQLDLRGTNFAGADLTTCTFLGCDLREVVFNQATMRNARFVESCRLGGAKLIEADLTGANLRGCSLAGADLRRATLDEAALAECDLSKAKLYQAVARGTRFDVSDMRGADLMSANLMHASFARATIYGVDFRGANLYGTDMARVRTDDKVELDQATMVKVRIHPKHRPDPPR
jgi:uncharacterized protein YjbI with pentapeptide repeats